MLKTKKNETVVDPQALGVKSSILILSHQLVHCIISDKLLPHSEPQFTHESLEDLPRTEGPWDLQFQARERMVIPVDLMRQDYKPEKIPEEHQRGQERECKPCIQMAQVQSAGPPMFLQQPPCLERESPEH